MGGRNPDVPLPTIPLFHHSTIPLNRPHITAKGRTDKMTANKRSKVRVWCDGACSPNPGNGGWAAVLKFADKEKELSGCRPDTTNNRMELTAAVEALSALTEPCEVVVSTDSKYLADCFRQGWMDKWVRNGWKTAAKKPVKNRDLWERLYELTRTHKVTREWVEGHAGHPENERVDRLAVKAREALK